MLWLFRDAKTVEGVGKALGDTPAVSSYLGKGIWIPNPSIMDLYVDRWASADQTLHQPANMLPVITACANWNELRTRSVAMGELILTSLLKRRVDSLTAHGITVELCGGLCVPVFPMNFARSDQPLHVIIHELSEVAAKVERDLKATQPLLDVSDLDSQA